MIARIGNGLYARAGNGPTVLEAYRAKQATCPHTQKDPHGTCYACGKRQEPAK